jgi:hypothetical protein
VRILICGDRDWKDLETILYTLSDILVEECDSAADWNDVVIIHGDARGADRLGARAAEMLGTAPENILSFPADWNGLGKPTGIIRNRQMLTDGKPDLILAFHNAIDKSRGTRDMLSIAKKAGVSRRLFTQEGEVTDHELVL